MVIIADDGAPGRGRERESEAPPGVFSWVYFSLYAIQI
jgi:hypothetical protein